MRKRSLLFMVSALGLIFPLSLSNEYDDPIANTSVLAEAVMDAIDDLADNQDNTSLRQYKIVPLNIPKSTLFPGGF